MVTKYNIGEIRMGKRVKRMVGIFMTILFVVGMLPGTQVSAAVKPVLSKTSQNILVGKAYDFNIKNKISGSTYQWSTSNSKIASVTKTGYVKGLRKGTAEITCKISASGNTYQLKAKVSVLEPATSIVINNKVDTMKVGETLNLDRTLSPKTSNDKTIWNSSDATIATPDAKGQFTALKAGKVTISATTLSGAKTSVTITVNEEAKDDLVLTGKDVKEGKVKVSGGIYHNIAIDNSVGNAEITLTDVHITGTLYLQTGADYTVTTKDTEITNIEVEKPEISTMAVLENVIPSLVAGRGTTILRVDVNGDIKITQTNMANIDNITFMRDEAGVYQVSLVGFTGNLQINAATGRNINIKMTDCNVGEVTMNGESKESFISFMDTVSGGNAASKIGKLSIVGSMKVNLEVTTSQVVIDKVTQNVELTVTKPVDKLENHGADTNIVTSGEGTIKEVTGTAPDTTQVTPTPSIPGPTGPSGPMIPPTDPNATPTPTPTPIPGVDHNGNTYTFDENIKGIRVKVGENTYPITKSAVWNIVMDWDTFEPSYLVPGTNGLVLTRTPAPFTYIVSVPGADDFTMSVDVYHYSVTIGGNPDITIEAITN
jgi:uncharacterized protein YjdB